jgi:hypothetical protein
VKFCVAITRTAKKANRQAEVIIFIALVVGFVCLFVCLLHQGSEPRPLVALQPLGLLYALFSRSLHCRRQMSPRPTRRERSKRREVEL